MQDAGGVEPPACLAGRCAPGWAERPLTRSRSTPVPLRGEWQRGSTSPGGGLPVIGRAACCIVVAALLSQGPPSFAGPQAFVQPPVRAAAYQSHERHAAYVPLADGTRLAVTWYLPAGGPSVARFPGAAVVHARSSREHRPAHRHDPSGHGCRGTRIFHGTRLCGGRRRDARQRRLIRIPRHRSRSPDRQGRARAGGLDRSASRGPAARWA